MGTPGEVEVQWGRLWGGGGEPPPGHRSRDPWGCCRGGCRSVTLCCAARRGARRAVGIWSCQEELGALSGAELLVTWSPQWCRGLDGTELSVVWSSW